MAATTNAAQIGRKMAFGVVENDTCELELSILKGQDELEELSGPRAQALDLICKRQNIKRVSRHDGPRNKMRPAFRKRLVLESGVIKKTEGRWEEL